MRFFNPFRKKNRAEKNEATYRRWLSSYVPKNSQKIALKRVYTDRQGNNYYVPADMLQVTRERRIRMEEALATASYGMSAEELESKVSELREEIDNFPWSAPTAAKLRAITDRIKNTLGDIAYRVRRVRPEDLMLQAALYLFFIDNENPYIVNPDTQQQKWDNLQSDPELRSFFLDTIEAILTASAMQSVETSQG
jgi:hypothetical protein